MFDLSTRRGWIFADALLVTIVAVLYLFMGGDWASRLVWAITWGMAYWVLIMLTLWGWDMKRRSGTGGK